MTDPVNGCRYCGKDRRAHAQEQHAGRPGFEAWVEPTDEQRKERLRVRAATPAGETALTDEEWREFQAIPDQGYSQRGWVDARIKQRLAASPATITAEQREAMGRALARRMSSAPDLDAPGYITVAVHADHNEYVVAGFVRVALENEQIDADVTVTPLVPQGAATCAHSSATGVDQTPLNDPAKAWRCDVCGLRWSATSPADADAAEVERAWDEGYRSALLTASQASNHTAERIAQAIEVEMRRHDRASVGFSAVGDAYAHAARIAREHATTPEDVAIDLPGFEGTRSALDALTTRKEKTDD